MDDDDDDPFGLDERFRRNQRRRVSEGDDDAFGLGEHLHTSGCVFFCKCAFGCNVGMLGFKSWPDDRFHISACQLGLHAETA